LASPPLMCASSPSTFVSLSGWLLIFSCGCWWRLLSTS
jgi:hypothetical protein